MSDKYKMWDPSKAYFLTITVVGWIDAFTRKSYKFTLINSLQYCQREKGLILYGYCIMPSHIHLIARAEGKDSLSDILHDFKKFTSKALIQQIISEDESRREISSNKFFDEKLDYIHNNPVEEAIVERPEDYIFSSARNYAGLDNYLEIVLESVKQSRFRKENEARITNPRQRKMHMPSIR